MSKKSKRSKGSHIKITKEKLARMLQSEQQINQARTQMLEGEFAGAITTCSSILSNLSLRTAQKVEVLAFLGLAHAMQQNYQQSYNAFTEALTLDPNDAQLWYNRGLSCRYTTRFGQAFRDFERAVELLGTKTGEMAQKFARELKLSRKLAQDSIKLRGDGFTLDQLIEQDEQFQHGMKLMQESKWEEAEQAFRRVLAMGACLPPQWGNLGVCLLMQLRYDEAETALREALALDPDYTIAKNNLALMGEIRQAGKPLGIVVRNQIEEGDNDQSITFYKENLGDSTTVHSVVRAKESKLQRGEMPPLHRFFLNPHRDARFSTCPECGKRTLQRMVPFLIQVNSQQAFVLNKSSRYCPNCDLLIVHQDELEEELAGIYPRGEKRSYQILGTLQRTRWRRNMHRWTTIQDISQDMLMSLHNFREIMTFKRAGDL